MNHNYERDQKENESPHHKAVVFTFLIVLIQFCLKIQCKKVSMGELNVKYAFHFTDKVTPNLSQNLAHKNLLYKI